MESKKVYVRKTISISKHINDMIDVLSNREFSGNTSAFIAHLVLQYIKCRNCTMNGMKAPEEVVRKKSGAKPVKMV